MTNERYERGVETLNGISSHAVKRINDLLGDICPDMAKLVIEFPYGDIYSRPGLGMKSRELITIASLTTLGYAKDQLKAHIDNALNVGCTKEEIVEVIRLRRRPRACPWRKAKGAVRLRWIPPAQIVGRMNPTKLPNKSFGAK